MTVLLFGIITKLYRCIESYPFNWKILKIIHYEDIILDHFIRPNLAKQCLKSRPFGSGPGEDDSVQKLLRAGQTWVHHSFWPCQFVKKRVFRKMYRKTPKLLEKTLNWLIFWSEQCKRLPELGTG